MKGGGPDVTSMNQSLDILPRHRAREGAREHYNHTVRMTDLVKQVCSWYVQLPLGLEHYSSHKVGGLRSIVRSSNRWAALSSTWVVGILPRSAHVPM